MRGLWLALAVAACGAPARPAGEADRDALVPVAAPEDEVVALVDRRPIHASAVRTQMRAAGVDARAALAALVDAEVLAGAALGRGLHLDREVRAEARAAAVRRLLHAAFEPQAPPAQIPDADFRRLYELNKLHFDHDEAVDVWHVLAPAKIGDGPGARARARARIAALLPRAAAAPTAEAFAALAAEPGDPPLKVEHLPPFPRRGVVEDAFADAAFALQRPGATSGIVETSYGFHVIRFVERLPARHVGPEGARAELLPGALTAFRTRELDRWMRELVERTPIAVHPERLARLASGEGAP